MANRSLTSLPTIEPDSFKFYQKSVEMNEDTFSILLATFLPEVWRIWRTLENYNVNPIIIPPVIKAIGDISSSSKLGEVIIEIRPNRETGEANVVRIRAIDTKHLDVSANST